MNGRRGNRTRARDEDRSAASELIDAAYADGQLSLEEHDLRVSRALQARTMGDLRALTGDLQGEAPAAPPVAVKREKPVGVRRRRVQRPRAHPKSRLIVAGVVLATVVPLALLASIGLFGRDGDLFTVDGLEAMVEEARDDLGSTRVDDVIVFEHHAVLTRAQAGSPDRSESLIYRRKRIGGGFQEWTKRSRDKGETFVDLADVDVRAAIDLLERAPELVRVSESHPDDQHLQIQSTDGGRLYIYIDNEYHEDGWVIASLKGEIREVHPHDE